MNPLERAHLFANGKFKVAVKEFQPNPNKYKYHDIDGYDVSGEYIITPISPTVLLDRCTLIARPIDDMTDEEKRHVIDNAYGEHKESFTKDELEGFGTDLTDGFLYLLSIGVYPFNQQHFEDGTVLNINDLHLNA